MKDNGKILWGLVVVLILSNFGYTTYVTQQFAQVAEKIDTRLRIVETEQAIVKREQMARTEYFKELRDLMVDLREQIERRKK